MTESFNEAVSRVLSAFSNEADELKRAADASRNAVFKLLGVLVSRLEQYEERIQALESQIKLFEEGNKLPEPGDISEEWVEELAQRLWDAHLESTTFELIDKTFDNVQVEPVKIQIRFK